MLTEVLKGEEVGKKRRKRKITELDYFPTDIEGYEMCDFEKNERWHEIEPRAPIVASN